MSAQGKSPGKKTARRGNPSREPPPPRRRLIRFEKRPIELYPAGGGYRVIRRPMLLDSE